MRNRGKRSKLQNIFVEHINNNLKEYIILILVFVIGVIFGVIFINKVNETQANEISTYINDFINNIKNNMQINQGELLRSAIISNFWLAVTLWFMGSTIIGFPIVYGIIAFRGFCLGYTISSAIATLGVMKGITFAITSILLQNIIFIPCILALGVSGIKLCKSILKDKRKENIKIEITRHTIFCLFVLILLEVSAFVETYISANLLQISVKYI